MAWKRQATPRGRSWWVLVMSERRTDETASGSWPTAKASDGRTKGTGGSPDRGLDAMARAGLINQSWITPQARDGENRGIQSMRERVAQGHSMSLPEQVKDETQPESARPTPAARDWKDTGPTQGARKSPNLGTTVLQASAWPTPTATDAKASGAAGYSTASGRHSGTTLTDATVGPRGPALRSTTGKNRARLNHRWVAQLMGFPSDWLEGIDVPPSKPSATASSRKSSKPSDEQSEV